MDAFVVVDVASAADLPHAGDAGFDHEVIVLEFSVAGEFFIDDGARAYEAHFAFEDVKNLGQFIEACFAKESAAFCDTGIVFEFEIAFPFFARSRIGRKQFFEAFFGINAHAAEFVAGKRFPAFSDADVFKDDRAWAVFVNPGGNDEENRGNRNRPHDGQCVIENHFDQAIKRSRKIIFEPKQAKFFIKKAFDFHASHRDADEVRDDTDVFDKRLHAIDESGQIFFGKAGGGDEGMTNASFPNGFFDVGEAAQERIFLQNPGRNAAVIQKPHDAVSHPDVFGERLRQERRGLPGADHKDGRLQNLSLQKKFLDKIPRAYKEKECKYTEKHNKKPAGRGGDFGCVKQKYDRRCPVEAGIKNGFRFFIERHPPDIQLFQRKK